MLPKVVATIDLFFVQRHSDSVSMTTPISKKTTMMLLWRYDGGVSRGEPKQLVARVCSTSAHYRPFALFCHSALALFTFGAFPSLSLFFLSLHFSVVCFHTLTDHSTQTLALIIIFSLFFLVFVVVRPVHSHNNACSTFACSPAPSQFPDRFERFSFLSSSLTTTKHQPRLLHHLSSSSPLSSSSSSSAWSGRMFRSNASSFILSLLHRFIDARDVVLTLPTLPSS